MQTHISWPMKLLLVMIMLGGFGFAAPALVHAAAAAPAPQHPLAMGETSGQTSVGCYQQGCAQEHSTCQGHCVRESKDQTVVVVLTQTSIDPIHVYSTFQSETVDGFVQTTFLVATPDRAPPIHKLLRSVMKRE